MEKFIKRIAKEAGKITLKKFGKVGIKYTKAHALDAVTEADLLSNKFLVDSIKKKYSTHGIISEETEGYQPEAEYQWIIDPVDGTLNFSKGIPLYVILIALAHKGEVIMSVAYNPVMDELYFARLGKGAFKNGKKIHCSPHSTVANSAGCAGNTITGRNVKFITALHKHLKGAPCWCSGYASIGVSMTYLAEGKKDWFLSTSGNVWDYAAGYLLVKESGCVVTNTKGQPWSLNDRDLVGGNKKLNQELVQIVKAAKINA